MYILLSTGEQVAIIAASIGGAIILGVLLFLLYHFVISRNRIKHQVRELQKKYSYLDALLIGQDSEQTYFMLISMKSSLVDLKKSMKTMISSPNPCLNN